MDEEMISVIVPVYNEQDSLSELIRRLQDSLKKITQNYEVIFINDGSTDASADNLKTIYNNNQNVKVVNLRRNFGKSAGLNIGFSEAGGDLVVTIDADLQDRPEEISNLVKYLQDNNYDLVSGWKRDRHDPISKTWPSKVFNGSLRLISGLKLHDFNCGLKIYRREVIQDLPVYGQLHRFLPLLAYQYGFRVGELVVKHDQRKFGKSKYGGGRIISGFLDLITVTLLTRFHWRPNHFFGSMGFLSFISGFGIALYLTVIWFLGQRPIGNRPLFFLAILLIIIGIQLISLGLLGEMIISNRQQDFAKMIKNTHKHEQ